MPNIRAQRASKDELYIQGSDGREVTITRAQVVARFQSETGSRAQRRTKTLTWLRDQLVTALGEQVDPALLTADFDDQDATREMVLELRGG